MATHIGKEGYMYVGVATVAQIRGYTLNESSATVEDTVIGDAWTTHKGTIKSWQVSGDLFWDEADAGQLSMTMGTTTTVQLYPMGVVTATYKSGQAVIVGFDITGRHDSMVEASFSATGTGALSTLTI